MTVQCNNVHYFPEKVLKKTEASIQAGSQQPVYKSTYIYMHCSKNMQKKYELDLYSLKTMDVKPNISNKKIKKNVLTDHIKTLN